MPVFRLIQGNTDFPDPSLAHSSGLLAIGGNLSAANLMLSYQNGIFPWNNEDEELLWWCPVPRMVLVPEKVHISKSMRAVLRKGDYEVTFDKKFGQVLDECSTISRKGQDGTWLHHRLKNALLELHEFGIAHSVEVWSNEKLVGGLYGIASGRMFCGESMFSRKDNMSKVALIHLCRKLAEDRFNLIDCQQDTQHLRSMGAQLMPAEEFYCFIRENKTHTTLTGKWNSMI